MVLRDIAFAIINHAVVATEADRVEAFQFINDNGLVDDLTPHQLLEMRHLVELGVVYSPVLYIHL